MSCLRFLNENFLETDNLANYYASSEATGFTKENAQDALRRTKVWRSGGYWLITSGSNDGIVFEETASTPLTATIASGEYTSTTTFLAAIKTALEAVGASTYTVTTDNTTGRIKITSDGGGGGGIFNLLWSDVGSTAASTIGFAATDLSGALTYTADLLRISTEEFLTFDLGISNNPSVFAFVQSRNNPIQITPGATITLEGNETNAWTSPTYSQTLTYNSEVVQLMAASTADGLHTGPLRFWRLSINDVDNPDQYVEVGYIYLGEYFFFSQGAAQFPLQNQQVDNTTVVFSEGGQSFGDIREQTEEFVLNLRFMTVADKEELERTWQLYGNSTPFFMSLDSDANFSSDANRSFKLVRFQAQPSFVLERPQLWASQVQLREVL